VAGIDRFNWALDWFDAVAIGNTWPALWIKDEGGEETILSFAALSEPVDRVANHFRIWGAARRPYPADAGDVAPLWETMLASMKLGAWSFPRLRMLQSRRTLPTAWRAVSSAMS